MKMVECKYCSVCFEGLSRSQIANHSRWCFKNPRRQEYVIKNDGSQLHTQDAAANRRAGIKKAHDRGAYAGAACKAVDTKRKRGNLNHTEESKEKIRTKALASNHRRLIRSIRPYTKKDGSIVMLDSSWEEELARRLDELGIEWCRPDVPIKYQTSDGKIHNYFPDFFLPEYNLFLDPKNPFALKAQKEKIDVLKKIMDNLLIIETLDGCKTFRI
jgi:hypothetical protein